MKAVIFLGFILVFVALANAHGHMDACFNMEKYMAVVVQVEPCKDLGSRSKRHHNPEHDKMIECVDQYYHVFRYGQGTTHVENMQKLINDLAYDSAKADAMIKVMKECNSANHDVIPSTKRKDFLNCFWDTILSKVCP